MKFNRKVYVIPCEKYESIVEANRKKTSEETGRLAASAAIGSGAGQSSSLRELNGEPTFRGPQTSEGRLIENGGVPASNGNMTSNGVRSIASRSRQDEGLKKCTQPQSQSHIDRARRADRVRDSDDEIVRKLNVQLNSKAHRDKAHAISRLITLASAGGNGRVDVADYAGSLLHTQASKFPVPVGHHKFYCLLLERDVPLNLISNVKLRRILHYMKNKYTHSSEYSGGEGGEEEVEVEVEVEVEEEGEEEGEEEEEEEEEEGEEGEGEKEREREGDTGALKIIKRSVVRGGTMSGLNKRKKEEEEEEEKTEGRKKKRKNKISWIRIKTA